MDIRTIVLAAVLFMSLVLFGVGIGMLGTSFGEETRQPAIDVQEATRIVLVQFPNARIKEIELDTEDGKLVYEVELVTANGQKKEVRIDALTGRIEKIKND